jgi:hypothetical protein
MMVTPYIFSIPCFLWKTKATSLSFVKKKNDHVVCDYREKSPCREKRLILDKVLRASVQEFEMTHKGGVKETVYILSIHHSKGVFDYQDIALSNQRWKENAQALADAINKLVASRPF